MITVLVADDEPLVRELLVEMLAAHELCDVIGVAKDADGAVALASRAAPDVALVDVRMPGGGPEATRRIIASSPRTRVVALSGAQDNATALEMIEAGATSYLLKTSPPDRLVETLVRSASGERILADEISSGVLAGLTARLTESSSNEAERRAQQERIQSVIGAADAIEPHFQPIVELATGVAAGYEALSRFAPEPRRPPDVWFAEADASGLRAELELHAARLALGAFRAEGFLSLNLSPLTLGDAAALLADAGAVVVEVTEHAPIADYGAVRETVERLRSLGVRLAVDDAGAGFASLRHTLELLPDLIKLDLSLTRDIDQDRRRRALAAAMVGFATELGAAVVAEGVEREAEAETLRELGVHYAQGYLFGRPQPATR